MPKKCLPWQMVTPSLRLPSLQDARSGDAIAHLIGRFNAEGLSALETRHGGGSPIRYTLVECERILREFRRAPHRRLDGTATWSLTT
jgi:hypothetical protein